MQCVRALAVHAKDDADTLALPAVAHRRTREQHDRDPVTRRPFGEAFGYLFMENLADRERVIADNGIAVEPDISLRGARLLLLPCVTLEVAVQVLSAAVESFNLVIWAKLLNAALTDPARLQKIPALLGVAPCGEGDGEVRRARP